MGQENKTPNIELPDWVKGNKLVRQYTGDTADFLGCDTWYDSLCNEDKLKVWPSYNGSLVVKANQGTYIDWNGQQWDLYPGAFLQHFPGKHHILRRKDGFDWCECCVTLPENYFKAAVEMDFVLPDTPVIYPGLDLGLIERFGRLQQQYEKANNQQISSLVLATLEFLDYIKSRAQNDAPRNPLMEYVDQVENALKKDIDQEIDIIKLVSEFPISYAHLQRLFKKKTGMSMREYRLDYRIAMAEHYLLNSGLSIKEVAELVGYSDRYTFSKQFKKIKGLAPKQFVDLNLPK